MEGTLAVIWMFAGNFAPRNWAYCQGQILAISQNQALFSLLGTMYGGDGRTTFALPDFRGRVAVGVGNGPGLSNRPLAQRAGQETHTLTQLEMPNHTHPLSTTVAINTASGDEAANNGQFLASHAGAFSEESTAGAALGGVSSQIGNTGGGQAHNNMQPFLVMNYVICLSGIFPSRN